MVKILHFADAHIDVNNYGRRDPVSGLPLRVQDFLKALDTIVDTAIEESVDLVLFAGDAYKDRTPVPTFQREWGKRIHRLSEAQIPVLLLIGNHDVSPSVGRANALQEFETLDVPYVKVLSKPCFLRPADLFNLPVQILALPWISRSAWIASQELTGERTTEVYKEVEERLTILAKGWLEQADPELPLVLTAHASVQGADYGSERSVMLGGDLVLSGAFVKDAALDYVALGHIHKAQNLNKDFHPPVIYPGSIERVDFGEAGDSKYFVIANVTRGETTVDWRKLTGRKYIDRFIRLESGVEVMEKILAMLSPQQELKDAVVRLVIEYPRDWEKLIDEMALRQHTHDCFEFHLVRRPQTEARLRLPGDQAIATLAPLELLELYWKSMNINAEEMAVLQNMAQTIISDDFSQFSVN